MVGCHKSAEAVDAGAEHRDAAADAAGSAPNRSDKAVRTQIMCPRAILTHQELSHNILPSRHRSASSPCKRSLPPPFSQHNLTP